MCVSVMYRGGLQRATTHRAQCTPPPGPHWPGMLTGSKVNTQTSTHPCFFMQLVDSYSFNPHKWLLTNFDCCAMFMRDTAAVRQALSLTPVYLQVCVRVSARARLSGSFFRVAGMSCALLLHSDAQATGHAWLGGTHCLVALHAATHGGFLQVYPQTP